MEINALKTDRLQPGQLLRRPGSGEMPEDTAATCLAELPVLRRGEQSAAVESMQLLLMANGYALPQYGADGEWGDETQSAMERFQRENGLPPGDCDGAAWAELIG